VSDKQLEINIAHALQTANGKLPMEIVLEVPLGTTLAITGPSGSGKTTLLRQLAGLANPLSGRIKHGSSIWLDTFSHISLPTQKRNTGFVFQDYALFPHFSVYENLAFGLEKKTKTDVIEELLDAVDLLQLKDRKPHQLSGGQQQRVALARALVRKPDLLLLDEPLSALDYSMRKTLQDLLLRFHREFGFTMVIVTHDLGEIFRLANQVAVMENGKIVKLGTPAEVYVPHHQADEEIMLYGEILQVTHHEEYLILQVLIQQNVRQLKLPLHMSDGMYPGRSFTLSYDLTKPKISFIS
jgi:molybdate transport system ATP-binding protein